MICHKHQRTHKRTHLCPTHVRPGWGVLFFVTRTMPQVIERRRAGGESSAFQACCRPSTFWKQFISRLDTRSVIARPRPRTCEAISWSRRLHVSGDRQLLLRPIANLPCLLLSPYKLGSKPTIWWGKVKEGPTRACHAMWFLGEGFRNLPKLCGPRPFGPPNPDDEPPHRWVERVCHCR